MSSVDAHPLSGDGGLDTRPAEASDSLKALDDLMQVAEALCPKYPPRETFSVSSKFKL